MIEIVKAMEEGGSDDADRREKDDDMNGDCVRVDFDSDGSVSGVNDCDDISPI